MPSCGPFPAWGLFGEPRGIDYSRREWASPPTLWGWGTARLAPSTLFPECGPTVTITLCSTLRLFDISSMDDTTETALDSLPGVVDLHPVADNVGVIFCVIPIRDWDPDSDLTDLGLAGRPTVPTPQDPPPFPVTAQPRPYPALTRGPGGRRRRPTDRRPHWWGADDGSTPLSDPTLVAGPAPPLPGPSRGPGRAVDAADPPDGVETSPMLGTPPAIVLPREVTVPSHPEADPEGA